MYGANRAIERRGTREDMLKGIPGVWVAILVCVCAKPLAVSAAVLGPVDKPEELRRLIQAAAPGDAIVVADGQYADWSIELNCEGSVSAPIVLRPQSKQGAVFSGRNHFAFTGWNIRFEGFRFEDCILDDNLLELMGSENCVIFECVFENSGGNRATIGIKAGSKANRIENCRFSNIAARCINLNINEVIVTRGIPSGNVIRGNRFQDIPPANENGRETIKIGTNQPTYGHIVVETLVEDNVFERCDGEAEIISNKCSGNIYRRNVFNQCSGELVMRGGTNCLIEENRFFGGKGGIRLSGAGHTVRRNLVVNSKGTGIRLMYGMTMDQGGHYQAAGNCIITENTIVEAAKVGILIGDGGGKDWKEKGAQNVAPANNRFAGNIIVGSQGDLLVDKAGSANAIENNWFHRKETAIVSHPGRSPQFGDPLFRDPAKGDYRLGGSNLSSISGEDN